MKDFIGRTITPGCYVARGGKGNVACEYGMILYHVLDIKNEKLSVERLTVDYLQGQDPIINLRKRTISNPNAVVIVDPTPRILQLFDDARSRNLSDQDRDLIGTWIHGAEHQQPWS